MNLFDGIEIDKDAAAQIEQRHNEAVEAARQAVLLDVKPKLDNAYKQRDEAQAAAKAFEGVTPEQLRAYKQAIDENKDLKSLAETLQSETNKLQQERDEWEANAKKLDFSRILNDTVHKFNSQNPTVSVRDDMIDVLEMIAGQRVKDIDGQKVFTNADGTPIVKDGGYGDVNAFIEHMRTERPSLFNSPTGGGAPGQNSIHGSANKGDMGGDKKSRASAIASKFDLPLK